MLVLLPMLFGILTLVVVLGPALKFTTTVSFTPNSNTPNLSQIAGLAAKVGIPIPKDAAAQSPDFYVELVTSQAFLKDVALHAYAADSGAERVMGNLIELLEIDKGSPGKNLQAAIEALQKRIVKVSPNQRTSVVTISVRTKWPEVSEQIASRFLELINDFNLRSRQLLSGAERDFMQDRVATSLRELRMVEDSLQRFLQSNREFRQDPRLQFEHDRLQRAVGMRQQIYTTMVEGFEQARIESVRSTPSIAVVIAPARAWRADRRNTLPKLIAGGMLGLGFALMIAFARDAFRLNRLKSPAEEEFDQLIQEARKDLRRLTGLGRTRRQA